MSHPNTTLSVSIPAPLIHPQASSILCSHQHGVGGITCRPFRLKGTLGVTWDLGTQVSQVETRPEPRGPDVLPELRLFSPLSFLLPETQSEIKFQK